MSNLDLSERLGTALGALGVIRWRLRSADPTTEILAYVEFVLANIDPEGEARLKEEGII